MILRDHLPLWWNSGHRKTIKGWASEERQKEQQSLSLNAAFKGIITPQAKDVAQQENVCLVVLRSGASYPAPCRSLEVEPQFPEGKMAKLEGVWFLAWRAYAALLRVD